MYVYISAYTVLTLGLLIRQSMHTSAYVSMRQHTSAYVRVCIRQNTSAYARVCIYGRPAYNICPRIYRRPHTPYIYAYTVLALGLLIRPPIHVHLSFMIQEAGEATLSDAKTAAPLASVFVLNTSKASKLSTATRELAGG